FRKIEYATGPVLAAWYSQTGGTHATAYRNAPDDHSDSRLTPTGTCIRSDSFGEIGFAKGFAAHCSPCSASQPPTLSRMMVAGLSLGLPVVSRLIDIAIPSALYLTLPLPFFYYLVSGAARDIGGVIGAVLSSPPLRYIGRISYGLYV